MIRRVKLQRKVLLNPQIWLLRGLLACGIAVIGYSTCLCSQITPPTSSDPLLSSSPVSSGLQEFITTSTRKQQQQQQQSTVLLPPGETDGSSSSSSSSVQLRCRPDQDPKYHHRHSSQPYQAPLHVESIFNCDAPHPAKSCRYFYPSNFFDPLCGLGKDYAHLVLGTEERLRKRELWTAGPKIGFPTLGIRIKPRTTKTTKTFQQNANIQRRLRQFHGGQQQQQPPNEPEQPGRLERFSFIHVHKAGGTSMKECIFKLVKYASAQYILRYATRYPSKPFAVAASDDDEYEGEPSDHQHVMYAVVRDPVERFVSSVGQVMGSAGSQHALNLQFRELCLKATPKETLQCCIGFLSTSQENHGMDNLAWFELHFAPQALDIHFTSLWQDVPVAIFPMTAIPTLLNYFGCDATTKRREGSDTEYRPDPVLAQMSVHDFDANMIQDVCRLYHVDVLMMQSLGMTTRCDSIPYTTTNTNTKRQ